MSQDPPKTSRLPSEYWLLLGLGLGTSGLYYEAISVVAWYFFLRRFRPHADRELLMVASGFIGLAAVRIAQILTSGDNLYRVTEHVIFSVAALVLLFSQQRGLAWFLLGVSVLRALGWFLSAAFGLTKHARAQFMLLAGLIDSLWVWLLAQWLRRDHQRRKQAMNEAGPKALQ